ncbi:exodeoxyribonuclease I [Candidatus Saccharibacteria bacterium]|nr:exodeoxyribonuclease I [Candidatus Saccharibacteria bacterium]
MNDPHSFFFYDLETSGLSPREDRIMQFAGQRTDLELNPLGEPVNLLVELADDTLPSPGAIAVTKITPQQTRQDGLSEAEFCRYVTDEIFTPGTCALGYNSVRFDDEFMRHLFWRNFYDPYEWQWKDGRSRWDLLDVVRLTRALRPEGINWPTQEKEIEKDGEKIVVEVKTNRLELITKLNGIEHEHAHDALADVVALIEVTRLIKTHQPDLYNYLFKLRDKKLVQRLINLDRPKPFVYASGRYSSEFDKTTVAFPIAPSKTGNILVWDLRYDPEECWLKGLANNKEISPREITNTRGPESRTVAKRNLGEGPTECCDFEGREISRSQDPSATFHLYPKLKELRYNRCPAVAPLGVLEKNDGWRRIGLDKDTVEKNLKALLKHPEFAEMARAIDEAKPEFPEAPDPESALYDGFLGDQDRDLCGLVRAATKNQLADLHPEFTDPRLEPLLLHYKAKNFPDTLSEEEQKDWEKYRLARLNRQSVSFEKELQALSNRPDVDPSLVEELLLWAQSLASVDY